MSELDQDFEKTAEQINAKIKEAAEALRQANELATKAGLPSLIYTQFTRDDIQYQNDNADEPLKKRELEEKCDELEEKLELIDVSDLEDALSQAGWSTSSSYC